MYQKNQIKKLFLKQPSP